jgi:hypothetical protein
LDGIIQSIENGKSLNGGAAFSRRDTTGNMTSVITALPRVEKAAFPSDTLNYYFRISVDQNGHLFLYRFIKCFLN